MDKKEFLELYNKWHSSFIFSAHGSADPAAKEHYNKLIEWCKEHKEEGVQYIKEILEEEPNDIVMILQDLYGEEHFHVEGFMPLNQWCNVWLNILNCTIKNGKMKDYYKEWKEWHKYGTYIPWNSFEEEDPNVTFEEFKTGKRNDTGK